MQSKNIRKTDIQQEGELFAQLWLLDSQGCLYFDYETEIQELINHLKHVKQPFNIGYGNFRKKLYLK